ncbi:MAG TPA: deoxyribodipyrimidine photo-lyase [Desulfomonilia bacterium]|nr:deoxyribodipyrimidine photo-lyase [Desulfomonilia bacterium]
MKQAGIDPERVVPLNDKGPPKGDFVIYWMQQSQRLDYNHALQYAVHLADERGLGVVVIFCLMDDYPEANLRHYAFMLEGLRETALDLGELGMKFFLIKGRPEEAIPRLARRASLVVCDRGYLRHQIAWRHGVGRRIECPFIQVEGDVVIPVERVSSKAEYAARTIRPKMHRLLGHFLKPLETRAPRRSSVGIELDVTGEASLEDAMEKLSIDRGVPPAGNFFRPGAVQARRLFQKFLEEKLENYVPNHNQPQTDNCSCMSMYLHFGQISPMDLALKVQEHRDDNPEAVDAFLEELIVRRELAINFVRYTDDYDSFGSIPAWARRTLERHAPDRRPYVYSAADLDAAATHDPYWNAAMNEMKYTGFMHNYMRMYWGKKILEWSPTPREAYRTLMWLNNRHFLDGRDPNSYAGAGWVFGLHDRPWGERDIFGTVRTMTASGLERKCDIRAYVEKVGGYILTGSPGRENTGAS